MHTVMAMIAASALAVDFGWQSLPQGGYEYIIQVSPEMLESMRSGRDLTSELPPAIRQNVRSYRIVVGERKLPHQGELPPEPIKDEQASATDETEGPALTRADDTASKPSLVAGTSRESPLAASEQPKNQIVLRPIGYDDATLTPAPNSKDIPWMPLIGVTLALFASIGANVFLWWNTWSLRGRYRALISQQHRAA